MAVGGVGGDYEELVVAQFGDRQVGLEQPALVEPLGVRDPTGVAVDGIGGELVEHPSRARPGDPELGHEAHVHHDHTVATGMVFGFPLGPPRGPTPRQRPWIGRGVRSGEPVGALPPADIAEVGSPGRQPVVER